MSRPHALDRVRKSSADRGSDFSHLTRRIWVQLSSNEITYDGPKTFVVATPDLEAPVADFEFDRNALMLTLSLRDLFNVFK